MPSKLNVITIELVDYWEAIQPQKGQTWGGNDHLKKKQNRKMSCWAYPLYTSWVFMAQINIKKFIWEIIEPYILTPRGTVVREMGHSFVKAAPFSFHLTPGTSFKTVHLLHSAFLPQRSNHSTCLHIGGNKNIHFLKGCHHSAPANCSEAMVLLKGTVQTRGIIHC